MDLSEAFEEQPTQAQLRAEALRRLNSSEAWLPSENLTVKFVDLSHTEEYQAVAALQRVRLCDKVSVYCGPLGVSAVKLQVIRVVYDVMTERYSEIELGKPRTTFVQAITDTIEEATSDLPSVSMMQRAINRATDQITGANGGHVLFVYDANGDPQEILIMDTDDILTAVNVWRWNSGGLGFSSNGYAGPYALAMTADGQIVADMITTGKMSANHIEGGTLTLGGANNASGQLIVKNASGTTIGTWSNSGISVSSGSITGGTINGANLTLGGSGNASGTLQVLDASGTVIGQWNKDGITLKKGTISGPSITLGGSNNTNGTLTVKDSSNNTSVQLNTNGLSMYEGFLDLKRTNGTATSNIKIARTTAQIFRCTLTESDSSQQFYGTYIMDVSASGLTMQDQSNSKRYTYYGIDSALIWEKVNTSGPGFTLLNTASKKEIQINPDYTTFSKNSSVFLTISTRNSTPYFGFVGNFAVSGGTKSRLVTTDQYSDRLLYCYETPSPMFGDVGEGVIGEDGRCFVWLDAVFADTITTTQYQVFLQRYGAGDCYVAERRGSCFIVEGTPGLSFGWELKAKQKDFDQKRLDLAEQPYTPESTDYGALASQHIQDLQTEREAAA